MVSLREFSRQVGRSQGLISKLVNSGVIPRNEDGTIPVDEGLKAFREYQENAKRGRPPKGEVREVRPEPQKAKKPEPSPLPDPQEMSNFSKAMNKAKLAETTFKARLRELEYKLKNGDLIPKDDVSREASWMAEQVKAKLMAIPPRISSMCEGRVAREIEEIISDSINGALKELQKCKYSGDEE